MSTLLRFATAGSVDDGKSTLIGRLLFDSKGVLEDQWAAVKKTSQDYGRDNTDLALLTDGLRSEREQGITIDVAYRYFATANRKFIIADTPGHAQYTRNMITGASNARLAVVLVDVRRGLVEQSHRHAVLSSLVGVRQLVLAVNKMDLVDWDRKRFAMIAGEFEEFAQQLGLSETTAIPLSALQGDNVVTRSKNTPWYTGPTLLEHLEQVPADTDVNLDGTRLPVQHVIRPETITERDDRRYAGSLASGMLRVGDKVTVLPGGAHSQISSLESPQGPLDEATPAMAISVSLDDDLDIGRGAMIVTGDAPRVERTLKAQICWMSEHHDLAKNEQYLLKQTTQTTQARITAVVHRIDISTLEENADATTLGLNEIGQVRLRTRDPLVIDDYQKNAVTGSFILIDPRTNYTVAAGMVVPDVSSDDPAKLAPHPDVVFHPSQAVDQRPSAGATLWCTGLSGSGKSTVAAATEVRLLAEGTGVCVLDGDNLRYGLNADLGFSMEDRTENLRRLAHVATLMAGAGLSVLVPAISPLAAHRELARRVHAEAGIAFYEVYFDAPLQLCEKRDPKGLYARARSGELSDFTGVGSPYEPPEAPDLTLNSGESVQRQSQRLLELLERRGQSS